MHATKTNSGFLFGLTVLVGLMPLAFTFSPNGTLLLLDTAFKHAVWCGQATTLLLLLSARYRLSKNQLIGLSALYVFVPLAFTINENGASFLILNKHISSILSWAIASVLIGKLLMEQKWKENANL